MADYVMTTPGVVDFPHLFRPGQGGKYGVTLLIPKDSKGQAEAQSITGAILEAIRDGVTRSGGTNDDGSKRPAPFAGHNPEDKEWIRTLNLPLKDGDTDVYMRGANKGKLRKDVNKEFAGHWFVQLSTKQNPSATDPQIGRSRLIDIRTKNDLTQQDVYSGCKGRAKIWFKPYNREGELGVSASLVAFVKTDDGEPIAPPTGSSDPFSGFGFELPGKGAADGSDPLAGMV